MPSAYEIAVIRKGTTQIVASWPPGLSEERDFISEIVANVQSQGVGVFATEAKVLNAVRNALDLAFHELKSSVKP